MRRLREPRGPVTLESIADELEKLIRHTVSLDANIARLAARIQPFDGERVTERYLSKRKRPDELTLRSLWNLVVDADEHIRGAELDLSRIRSYVDSVFSDAVTREEMKEWITEPKNRK